MSPSNNLSINYDPTQTNYTNLNLINVSNYSVAFKIKTTSPQDFIVNPPQGYLKTYENITIRINFKGTEESIDKTHKFLVQAYASNNENVSEINWSNPNVQNSKISLVFVRDMRDSVYGDTSVSLDASSRFSLDITSDPYEEAEKHKNELMTQSRSLTSTLDKIKTEIEKAKHRLNFSKDLESLHKSNTSRGYSVTHLLIAALVGMLIGAFFMS